MIYACKEADEYKNNNLQTTTKQTQTKTNLTQTQQNLSSTQNTLNHQIKNKTSKI